MIHYLEGDVTTPQGSGRKLIVHICNSAGGWGAGVVLAISKRWEFPEAMYRKWYRETDPIQISTNNQFVWTSGRFGLGEIQVVKVESGLAVVNMIAQAGVGRANGPPLRYEALEICLEQVNKCAVGFEASIHMPRIGCSLGGGSWERVESVIETTLKSAEVFVYDWPGGTYNP